MVSGTWCFLSWLVYLGPGDRIPFVLSIRRELISLSLPPHDLISITYVRSQHIYSLFIETDGKLLFYPESAGTPDASTPIGGSESVYQAHSALLSTFLAPDYLGPNVSGPAALDLAQLCMTLGGLVGTIHGARICEAEGLDVGKFATKLGDLGKILVPEFQGIAKRIQDNEFGDTHASLEVYHDAGARVGEAANDAKLEMPWLFTMIKFMKSGVDMGIGKEDMAAAVKVLRK